MKHEHEFAVNLTWIFTDGWKSHETLEFNIDQGWNDSHSREGPTLWREKPKPSGQLALEPGTKAFDTIWLIYTFK